MLDEIPLPNYVEGELAAKPPYQSIDHQGAYGGRNIYGFTKMNDTDQGMVRAAYWAMCDLIDAQMDRLLRALEQTGQADRTLVIYMSDHGEMLGDHGIYLKGPFFYEPAIHVPLIVACLGRVVQRRSKAMVELTDLSQTVLDAAGLPHHPGMQGKSLWPMLTGAADADRHREDIYCEYYNALDSHREPAAHATMVRTARHKLAVDHSHNSGELYDLDTDPAETDNLWNSPAHKDIRAEMLLRLCHRMAWTVDPLPLRRSGW